MKMGSVDLIICHRSSGNIPYFQVGRDKQMNLDKPEELTEQMRLSDSLINSENNLDQQMQLTEEEDQNDTMMIGGIGIFLPCAQEEAENRVENGIETTREQSAVTVKRKLELEMNVKEKLEQTLKSAQAEMKEDNEHSMEWLNAFSTEDEETATGEFAAEDEEDEHSEEWLITFSQESERAVALELTAEGAEKDDEHSEEWLDIFSREAENTAARELAVADEEDTDSICFVDLWVLKK
jgi:hypothetical protein